MNHRAIPAAFATLLMLSTGLAAVVAPAVAQEPQLPPPPPLTQEDRERFVGLWVDRFTEEGWLPTYMREAWQIDDGFNAYDAPTKLGLVASFRERLEQVDADFHARMLTGDPAERRAYADEMFYLIIFDKEKFFGLVQDLTAGQTPPGDALPSLPQEGTEERTSTRVPGLNESQVGQLYAGIKAYHEAELLRSRDVPEEVDRLAAADLAAFAGLRAVPSEPTSVLPVEPATVGPADQASFARGFQPGTLPVAPDRLRPGQPPAPPVPVTNFTGLGLGDMLDAVGLTTLPGALPADLALPPVGSLVPALPVVAAPVDLPSVDLQPDLQRLLDLTGLTLGDAQGLLAAILATATFDVCWQHRDAPQPTCSTGATTYNAPYPVDLDGDGLPEGLATLGAPASLGTLPDATVSVTWRRLDNLLEPGDLPYQLFFRVRFPESDLHAILGLDGTRDSLPDATQLAFHLDVVELLDGGVRAGVQLVTSSGVDEFGFLGGVVRSRGLPNGSVEFYDPLLAQIQYRPVPTIVSMELRFRELTRLVDGMAAPARALELRLESDIPTTMEVGFLREATSSGGVTSAMAGTVVLDQLPLRANATLELIQVDQARQRVTLDYLGSVPIGDLDATLVELPDKADADDYAFTTLELEDVPTEVGLVADTAPDHLNLTYRASSAVTVATAAFGEAVDGEVRKVTLAEVHDIPTGVDVSVRPKAGGLVDADVTLSAPLGVARFLAFEGPGELPGVPAGDHVLIHQERAGGEATSLLSAQLTGFREAHLRQDSADAARATLRTQVPGPFAVVLQAFDRDASTEEQTQVVLSSIPEDIEVAFTRVAQPPTTHVVYEASETIAELTVYRRQLRPGELQEMGVTVEGVPARVELEARLPAGGPLNLTYDASSRIERILVGVLRQVPGDRQTIAIEVLGFTDSLRVGFDQAQGQLGLTANGGLVDKVTADLLLESAELQALHAEVVAFPSNFIASWGPEPGAHPMAFDASPAIGSLTLAFGLDRLPVLPPEGTGHYLAFLQPDDTTAITARIVGLEAVRLDPRNATAGDLYASVQFDGPHPLDVLVAKGTTSIAARVTNVPERFEVLKQGTQVLYKATDRIEQVEALVQQPDAARKLWVVVDGVSDEIVVNTEAQRPSFLAVGGIGKVRISLAEGAKQLGFIGGDRDGLVFEEDAQGRFLAAQITGVRRFGADYDGRHVHLDVSRDRDFFVQVTTPELAATAYLSNVPGNITVDIQEAQRWVTYRADRAIERLELAAQFQGTRVQALVRGVPTLFHVRWGERFAEVHGSSSIQEVRVGVLLPALNQGPIVGPVGSFLRALSLPGTMRIDWGQGFLDYKATDVVGDLLAEFLDMGTGLGFRAHMAQISRHVRMDYGASFTQVRAEPEAIGLLEAWARKAAPITWPVQDGNPVPDYRELPGSHAMFQLLQGNPTSPLDAGTVFYASFRLAGLRQAHLRSQGSETEASLTTQAPQYFQAYLLDRVGLAASRLEAYLDIQDLPSQVTVKMDPPQGRFDYDASGVIQRLEASVRPLDLTAWARLRLEDIPAGVHVRWSDDPLNLTYDATGRLGAIEVELYAVNSPEVGILARVEDLPRHMDFQTLRDPFNATFHAGAPDEDGIGLIQAYLKQAPAVCGQPREIGARHNPGCAEAFQRLDGAESHAMLKHLADDTTFVSFEYAGFRGFEVELGANTTHVAINNDAPQRFEAYVLDEDGGLAGIPFEAYADLQDIPERLSLDADLEQRHVHYEASDSWDRILLTARLLEETINATLILEDTPATIDLRWFLEGVTKAVRYDADRTFGRFFLEAHLGDELALLGEALELPAHMGAFFDDLPTGPRVFVDADVGQITLHVRAGPGDYHSLEGDHVLLEALPEGYYGSFRFTGFKSLAFETNNLQKLTHIRIETDGNSTVEAYATDARDPDNLFILAHGFLGPLPTRVDLTLRGDIVDYVGENFDVAMYVEMGPQARLNAIPFPDQIHGLHLRANLDQGALKANLWLTGLPETVHLDAANNTFNWTGFRPRGSQQTIVPNPAWQDAEDLVQAAMDLLREILGLFGSPPPDEELRVLAIEFLLVACEIPMDPDLMPRESLRNAGGLPITIQATDEATGRSVVMRLEDAPLNFSTSQFGKGARFAYQASGDSGPLSVAVTIPLPSGLRGPLILEAGIENLPTSLDLALTTSDKVKISNHGSGALLDGMFLGFRRGGSSTYMASLEIGDVPNEMDLSIDGGDLSRIISYTADSDGLDFEVFVDFEFLELLLAIATDSPALLTDIIAEEVPIVDVNIEAHVRIQLTDLGGATSLGLNTENTLGELVFSSEPHTCRFVFDFTLSISVNKDFDFDIGDGDDISFHFGFGFTLGAEIRNFEIRLERMSSFTMGIDLPVLRMDNFDGYMRIGWERVGFFGELRFEVGLDILGVEILDLNFAVPWELALNLKFMTFHNNPSNGDPSTIYRCVDFWIADACLRIETRPRHVHTFRNEFVLSTFDDLREGDDPNARWFIAVYPENFIVDKLPSDATGLVPVEWVEESLVKLIVVLLKGEVTEVDCC